MNQKHDHLLSIGAFAQAAQLSIKALRLYEQLDILRPQYIDPHSNYRYYAEDQIRAARLVRRMRQMDIPLVTIRQVLEGAPDEAESLITAHVYRLQTQLDTARLMVHDLIHLVKGQPLMTQFEVSVKTVPTQTILSVARRIKIDGLISTIREGVDRLKTVAQEQHIASNGTPFGIYHGPINEDADGPIEVCLPVASASHGDDVVSVGEASGGKVAYVDLHGQECHFPKIIQAYDALMDWIRQNGYYSVEAPREIWHQLEGDEAHMTVEWRFDGVEGRAKTDRAGSTQLSASCSLNLKLGEGKASWK